MPPGVSSVPLPSPPFSSLPHPVTNLCFVLRARRRVLDGPHCKGLHLRCAGASVVERETNVHVAPRDEGVRKDTCGTIRRNNDISCFYSSVLKIFSGFKKKTFLNIFQSLALRPPAPPAPPCHRRHRDVPPSPFFSGRFAAQSKPNQTAVQYAVRRGAARSRATTARAARQRQVCPHAAAPPAFLSAQRKPVATARAASGPVGWHGAARCGTLRMPHCGPIDRPSGLSYWP